MRSPDGGLARGTWRHFSTVLLALGIVATARTAAAAPLVTLKGDFVVDGISRVDYQAQLVGARFKQLQEEKITITSAWNVGQLSPATVEMMEKGEDADGNPLTTWPFKSMRGTSQTDLEVHQAANRRRRGEVETELYKIDKEIGVILHGLPEERRAYVEQLEEARLSEVISRRTAHAVQAKLESTADDVTLNVLRAEERLLKGRGEVGKIEGSVAEVGFYQTLQARRAANFQGGAYRIMSIDPKHPLRLLDEDASDLGNEQYHVQFEGLSAEEAIRVASASAEPIEAKAVVASLPKYVQPVPPASQPPRPKAEIAATPFSAANLIQLRLMNVAPMGPERRLGPSGSSDEVEKYGSSQWISLSRIYRLTAYDHLGKQVMLLIPNEKVGGGVEAHQGLAIEIYSPWTEPELIPTDELVADGHGNTLELSRAALERKIEKLVSQRTGKPISALVEDYARGLHAIAPEESAKLRGSLVIANVDRGSLAETRQIESLPDGLGFIVTDNAGKKTLLPELKVGVAQHGQVVGVSPADWMDIPPAREAQTISADVLAAHVAHRLAMEAQKPVEEIVSFVHRLSTGTLGAGETDLLAKLSPAGEAAVQHTSTLNARVNQKYRTDRAAGTWVQNKSTAAAIETFWTAREPDLDETEAAASHVVPPESIPAQVSRAAAASPAITSAGAPWMKEIAGTWVKDAPPTVFKNDEKAPPQPPETAVARAAASAADGPAVPDQVARQPAAPAELPAQTSVRRGPPPTPPKKLKMEAFGEDLTYKMAKKLAAGTANPVIGRDEEIETLGIALNQRKKTFPVLVGEPGVGKTQIVEGLALQIAEGTAPAHLLGKRIIEIRVSDLIADTGISGTKEKRMKDLLQEIKDNPDVILFIDELHTLMGAGVTTGNESGGVDNILKGPLSRAEVPAIGATTFKEYKIIEKDGAMERRATKITVREPTGEDTVKILWQSRHLFERDRPVTVTRSFIRAAVAYSKRYVGDRFLPDKAFDLLDAATARADIKQRGKHSQTGTKFVLTAEDARKAVEKLKGIPIKRLDRAGTAQLAEMAPTLKRQVVGQDHAVEALARAVVAREVANSESTLEPSRPVSFVFMGPTGVGKTELTKALAEYKYGDPKAMVRIDMSEFMEKASVSRLIGAPPGYVGYGETAVLTEPIRQNGHQVILLDEIEKAHPDVFNLLLQVLDDGRLTDSEGHTVDFRNTTIIMTSNIVQQLPADAPKDPESLQKYLRQMLVDRGVKPEVVNRVMEIVVFNHLPPEAMPPIVAMHVDRISKGYKKHYKIAVTPKAQQALAEQGYDRKFGARPLAGIVRRKIEDEIPSLIVQGKLHRGEALTIDFKEGDFTYAIAKREGKALAQESASPSDAPVLAERAFLDKPVSIGGRSPNDELDSTDRASKKAPPKFGRRGPRR